MLHPQARGLLKLMEEKGVAPVHTLSPGDARALLPRAPHVHASRPAAGGQRARSRAARTGGARPLAQLPAAPRATTPCATRACSTRTQFRRPGRATLVSFERQVHGFITMGRVIDEANAAVQLCAAQLKQALA
jgi:hypothetical protein